MYNKLFTRIVDSSIWLAPDPVRLVWITFLAVMDEDGVVALKTTANVAHRARVSLEDAAQAIKVLESPEPETATDDDDGRRIERIPDGWLVLNAKKYKDMVSREIQRVQTRDRTRRYRARLRGDADVTESDAAARKRDDAVTPSETETYTETEKKKKAPAAPAWSTVENLDQEAWALWLEFRRVQKMPAYKTLRSAQSLAKFPVHVQRDAIQHSMDNCYQGLMPEKVKYGGNTGRTRATGLDRIRDAAAKHGIDPDRV